VTGIDRQEHHIEVKRCAAKHLRRPGVRAIAQFRGGDDRPRSKKDFAEGQEYSRAIGTAAPCSRGSVTSERLCSESSRDRRRGSFGISIEPQSQRAPKSPKHYRAPPLDRASVALGLNRSLRNGCGTRLAARSPRRGTMAPGKKRVVPPEKNTEGRDLSFAGLSKDNSRQGLAVRRDEII